MNYLTNKARVFVPDAEEDDVSAPEPDLAAYRNFPLERDWEEIAELIADGYRLAAPRSLAKRLAG